MLTYNMRREKGGYVERTTEPIQIKNVVVIPKIDGEKLTRSVNSTKKSSLH